jgi:hypothetical protein
VNDEQRMRALYDAFNARDMDTVLAAMTVDVDWPNAWEGGRVHGRDAVRSYWTRQWAEINARAEPLRVRTNADGHIVVDVEQVVRDLNGEVLGEGRVLHIYEMRDGLVARMDVEEA